MDIGQNTQGLVDFLNESIRAGTLVATIGKKLNEIVLNNGEPYNCGVSLNLDNVHAGGHWSVNDWTG